jgi:hypothetical protein
MNRAYIADLFSRYSQVAAYKRVGGVCTQLGVGKADQRC